MRPRRRTWTGWIVAASLAVHVAVLTVLALHAPRLKIPREIPGPPEAVIPVLIIPRTPPPTAAPGARPQPIRLHRRQTPFAPDETPVAPLVAPTVETKAAPSPAPGPRSVTAPPPEDAVAVNARQALRGRLGCANASLLGLSREERQKCEDALAAGAKSSDYLGTGIDAEKAGGLAEAARRKEADFKYKRSTTQASPGGGPSRGDTPSEAIGSMVGSDKPTARVPF